MAQGADSGWGPDPLPQPRCTGCGTSAAACDDAQRALCDVAFARHTVPAHSSDAIPVRRYGELPRRASGRGAPTPPGPASLDEPPRGAALIYFVTLVLACSAGAWFLTAWAMRILRAP